MNQDSLSQGQRAWMIPPLEWHTTIRSLERRNTVRASGVTVVSTAPDSCKELDNLLTSLHRCVASKDPEKSAHTLFAVCDVLAYTGPCLLAAECCQLVLKQLDLSPEHHTRVLIEQSRSLRLAGQIEPSRISIKWALAKA